MKWKKLGIVYCPSGELSWAKTHAMIPTPVRINDKAIRVYVTFCDSAGIGRPGFVDVSAQDPRIVLAVSSSPLLELGAAGTFDDNGLLTCSVTNLGNGLMYLYYVGFELCTKIRYRLFTGLAVSNDEGNTFKKYKQTPILAQSENELFFRCGPCCIYESGVFRLWYVAGSEWENIDGKSMPVYDIRYAESSDGITWPDHGVVQISITENDEHGFGRPYVIPNSKGGYRMFYSIRKRSLRAYRMGYAESDDGQNWERMDSQINLDVSKTGFDSEAIMYAAPIEVDGKLYVFYNGNEFGKAGFAVALLEQD